MVRITPILSHRLFPVVIVRVGTDGSVGDSSPALSAVIRDRRVDIWSSNRKRALELSIGDNPVCSSALSRAAESDPSRRYWSSDGLDGRRSGAVQTRRRFLGKCEISQRLPSGSSKYAILWPHG